MAKISVIIPVYNIEKYLIECLDSVTNQTYKDTEIICINDGSTDGSLSILEEYSQNDNRIKIITKENEGQGVARNIGIDIATGEYVTFIDSDDYYASNEVLERMYSKSITNDADLTMFKGLAYSDIKTEEMNDRLFNLNHYLNYVEKENFKINIHNFYEIIDRYPCVTWGILYKTEFLKKNNIKNINKKITQEDNGFFLKVCASFPTCNFIDELAIKYRVNQASTISKIDNNKKQKDKDMQAVLADTINYIENNKDLKISRKLINDIKCSNQYYKYFAINIKGILTYHWGRENKRIRLLGFPIYRNKINIDNNGKHIIKLFGLPIYIKSVQSRSI